MPDMVEISQERYDELLDSELELTCLENAGVDNWQDYPYACKLYEEAKGVKND